MGNKGKQIVLIGGGYASIWAYRTITRELLVEMMDGQVQIKIICPEEFHCFHGWTAESLTGIIADENRMSPLSELFKHAEIIKGKAAGIDPHSQEVLVDLVDGTRIPVFYDQLFIGMGSFDNISLAGLDQYGYRLKSEQDYCKAKSRILYLIRSAAADRTTAEKKLRFVVAGGGITGVEIAANLGELLKTLKKQYPTLREIASSIQLISSQSTILPGLCSGTLRRYAEKILLSYGIETICDSKIKQVTDRGVFLANGQFLESQMVISTIGQRRIKLAGTQFMDRDAEHRIILNGFLQVQGHPNIWGAGDAVHVNQPGKLGACPSNALWAIKQGEHAGKNMARTILLQSPKSFTYRGLGHCASLGVGKGMGDLYGLPFTGWLAWMMRWFFFQYYMPSRKVMFREITDWFHCLIYRSRKRFLMPELDLYLPVTHRRQLNIRLNQAIFQN